MDMSEFILGGGAGGLFGEKRWIFHVDLAFVAVSYSQRVTAGRRTRLTTFSLQLPKTLFESEITRSDFETDSTGERKLPKSKIYRTKKNKPDTKQTNQCSLFTPV